MVVPASSLCATTPAGVLGGCANVCGLDGANNHLVCAATGDIGSKSLAIELQVDGKEVDLNRRLP